MRHWYGRMEVLTTKPTGDEMLLPVFSAEEEAASFLRSSAPGFAPGSGWRVRETGAGELVSVLCGPCREVERVALDPSPEMAASATADLVSVGRKRFADSLVSGHEHLHPDDGPTIAGERPAECRQEAR